MPLTIAITGSGGFVGSALMPFLTTGGHRVVPLSSNRPVAHSLRSNQGQTRSHFNLDPLNENHVDAVVNLAGENIFG